MTSIRKIRRQHQQRLKYLFKQMKKMGGPGCRFRIIRHQLKVYLRVEPGNCRKCHGNKFYIEEGNNWAAATICPGCNGTGKRQ